MLSVNVRVCMPLFVAIGWQLGWPHLSSPNLPGFGCPYSPSSKGVWAALRSTRDGGMSRAGSAVLGSAPHRRWGRPSHFLPMAARQGLGQVVGEPVRARPQLRVAELICFVDVDHTVERPAVTPGTLVTSTPGRRIRGA
jgi:hypothetical protein